MHLGELGSVASVKEKTAMVAADYNNTHGFPEMFEV